MNPVTIHGPDGQVLGYAAQTGRDGTWTLHTANGLCLVQVASTIQDAQRILLMHRTWEDRHHG